jgi:hypothetical protein
VVSAPPVTLVARLGDSNSIETIVFQEGRKYQMKSKYSQDSLKQSELFLKQNNASSKDLSRLYSQIKSGIMPKKVSQPYSWSPFSSIVRDNRWDSKLYDYCVKAIT